MTDTHVTLHRYEEQIAGMETAMAESPPEPGGILLYGSSTMAHWRRDGMDRDHLAPLPVINHGFGGSTAEEALYFYHRLVWPVKPAVLAYYEGPNDFGSGYTPSQVLAFTHRLFEWCRQDFPGIRFVIFGLKHSPALKRHLARIRNLNRRFSDYADRRADTDFVDLTPIDREARGARLRELYVDDDLHHTPAGYRLLASLVRPAIERAYREATQG